MNKERDWYDIELEQDQAHRDYMGRMTPEEREERQKQIRLLKEPIPRKMTASEFLDRLAELFSNCDGLTTQEIREDLEVEGVNVDIVLMRIEELLNKYELTMYKKDIPADYQMEAKDDMF